jgi:hypothetical protein
VFFHGVVYVRKIKTQISGIGVEKASNNSKKYHIFLLYC